MVSCGNSDYKYEGLQTPAQLKNCIIVEKQPFALENANNIYYLRISDTSNHLCKMANIFANKYKVGDTIK